MTDLLELIWRFLRVQPLENFLGLLPWHLIAVLAGLGLLGGFGLHFLIGYVFRFYRRGPRLAWWLSSPSLIVMLLLVEVLLGAYLLGSRAGALVSVNVTEDLSDRMGRLLLQPVFGDPQITALQASEVGQGVLVTTLASAAGAEYRASLQALIVPPGVISSQGNGEGAPAQRILLQVGLRWVTAPHRTWLSPLRPHGNSSGGAGDSGEQSLPGSDESVGSGGAAATDDSGDSNAKMADDIFLPDYLASLIGELPPQAELPREDWEHVAGVRFVEGVLEPLMVEYLSYLSIALASLSGLLALLYLYLLRKVRGIGMKAVSKELVVTDATAASDASTPPQASELPGESTPAGDTWPAVAAGDAQLSQPAGVSPTPPESPDAPPTTPEHPKEAAKREKAALKDAAKKEKAAKKEAAKREKAAGIKEKKIAQKKAQKKAAAQPAGAAGAAAEEKIEMEDAPEDRVRLEDPEKAAASAAKIISGLPPRD